jgi:hypothetical protein
MSVVAEAAATKDEVSVRYEELAEEIARQIATGLRRRTVIDGHCSLASLSD